MGSIACKCGHIILNQTDSLPYKARYVRDQDVETYYKYLEVVKDFLVALKKGNRVLWIKNNFGQDYPTDLEDGSIIHDILMRDEATIYQCENCGRLLVQNWGTNSYSSFYPEDDKARGLFKKN